MNPGLVTRCIYLSIVWSPDYHLHNGSCHKIQMVPLHYRMIKISHICHIIASHYINTKNDNKQRIRVGKSRYFYSKKIDQWMDKKIKGDMTYSMVNFNRFKYCSLVHMLECKNGKHQGVEVLISSTFDKFS